MGLDLKQPAVPRIDQDTCTGCGRCAEVCSSRTLAMEGPSVSVATRLFNSKDVIGNVTTAPSWEFELVYIERG